MDTGVGWVWYWEQGGGEGGPDKTAPRLQRDFVKRLNEIMQVCERPG